MTRVVVAGAGLGGLSAACHLAGRGHDVVVVERSGSPGGLAGRLELGGYRFDTGPTVLTMPELLEDTLGAAGVDLDDVVELEPLDPIYRASFADGSVICVRHGREAMAAEIRQTCGPAEAHGFERLADWLTALYEAEMGPFIDRNFDGPLDLARSIGPLAALVRLGALRRLSTVVGRFLRDERLRRLFTFQSMYAGLGPHQALAVFGVITYMDTVGGVYWPTGGIHAVPEALAAAAAKAGAAFRYDSPVAEILVESGTGRVGGVRLGSGENIGAEAVVCNVPLPGAYDLLPEDICPPRPLRRARFAPSALVWHAGLRGRAPEGTAHHNLYFGSAWDGAFRALLHQGRRMPDPSTLVTVASGIPTGLAPPGCHSLYVLEPVPNLEGSVDWAREAGRARDELAARIRRFGFDGEIEADVLHDPRHWAGLGMAEGTPFSIAHRFFQSGPFRPANTDRRLPGLVFVGAGTVPGIGVPMVLLSGRLAADRVEDTAA